MEATRREFVGAVGAAAIAAAVPVTIGARGPSTMYGLIGKMKAVPGQREALIAVMVQVASAMPGCSSYIVAEDSADPDAIWVTEVWDTPESHKASLSLPSVQEAIKKGRPLIAGFGERFETRPIGGYGLAGH